MTHAAVRCSPNTRLAGLLSALVATATFTYLQAAYERLPLLVPISFDAGSPLQFAFKSPGLVYLPFGLQLALGVIFAAVVAALLYLQAPAAAAGGAARETARHTAEGVALLASVWIAFQAVNAWRLTELWRRTYDTHIELYVLALITALVASLMIGLRVVLKVQEAAGVPAGRLREPVLDAGRPMATAGLAAILAVGIATPLYLLSVVWEVLRQI
jgi:hypothetical protein